MFCCPLGRLSWCQPNEFIGVYCLEVLLVKALSKKHEMTMEFPPSQHKVSKRWKKNGRYILNVFQDGYNLHPSSGRGSTEGGRVGCGRRSGGASGCGQGCLKHQLQGCLKVMIIICPCFFSEGWEQLLEISSDSNAVGLVLCKYLYEGQSWWS